MGPTISQLTLSPMAMTQTPDRRDKALQLLEFRQGGQAWLLDMSSVDRVIALDDASTGESGAEDLPRIRAAEALDLDPSPETDRQGVVLVRKGDRVMLVVDRVQRIFEVPSPKVHPAPARIREGRGGRLLQGFVECDGQLVAWIDAEGF